MLRFCATIICLSALVEAGQHAKAQPNSGSSERSASMRITIDNLVSAAPLPDDYEINCQDIKRGDKLLGHKLTLTKEGAVSKVIVSIEKRKIATRAAKVAATNAYINGVVQSFRAAGLMAVEKDIPEIDEHDFKKRLTVNLVYKNPVDGSRLFVQIQIFFTDLGHTVLVVSDDEEDHELLTGWAGSVMGK